jgi:hypothetical protein
MGSIDAPQCASTMGQPENTLLGGSAALAGNAFAHTRHRDRRRPPTGRTRIGFGALSGTRIMTRWSPIAAALVCLLAIGWIASASGSGDRADAVRSSVTQYLGHAQQTPLGTFSVDNILFSPSDATYAHFVLMTSGPSGGDAFGGFAHRSGDHWSVVRLAIYGCAPDAPPVPASVLSDFGENCVGAAGQMFALSNPSRGLSADNDRSCDSAGCSTVSHSTRSGDLYAFANPGYPRSRGNSVAQGLQVRVERRSVPQHRPSSDTSLTTAGAAPTGLFGLGQP